MSDIAELIEEVRTTPVLPVIQDLFNETEIGGLHGAPESFKTTFCLQLAESLALATPFLGLWQVPRPRTVYFFETEMSVHSLGERLRRMYANCFPPGGIHLANEHQLRLFRRTPNLAEKFARLREWIAEAQADVLILDTCNPFFRGKQSPNDETVAGEFFDLLEAVPALTKLFVRHNRKRRAEDSDEDAAAKIRGSGQFSDVPDLLLELRRTDRRCNEATFAITKFRHGSKPDDLTLWFDTGEFRLVSVPPVIHLLKGGPRSRQELLADMEARFSIGQRVADQMIADYRSHLIERMDGHRRVIEIDWNAARDEKWRRCVGEVG